jgi:hypothetical protein
MRGHAVATLSDLKARITDDLARSDLTSQIAAAITDAITHYQDARFYFNETRNVTFSTVAGQQIYTGSDVPEIPKFTVLDAVYVTVSGTVYDICREYPQEIETLSDSSATRGQPWSYSYFDQSIRFYPIPDQAYPVRIQGHIRLDAPASDGDGNNAWMNEAFELIRCRAKRLLAAHVIKDMELLQVMDAMETSAFERLVAATSRRIATGHIVPTQF